jgi:outer membrane protein OmpA-like peptidoglycan-associated protein
LSKSQKDELDDIADALNKYSDVKVLFSPDRISINSEGELKPLVKNDFEGNRKLNRRVELIVE